jgi:putative aldouronate transport system permease protein
MAGLALAFQDFIPGLGLFESEWVGFKWFSEFIEGAFFWRLVRNTFLLSFYTLLFAFPVPIIFALLLNEVMHVTYKRVVQTLSYLPHFISLVVIVGILMNMFNYPDGIINKLVNLIGIESINFFNNPKMFRPLYVASEVWQGFGWNSILYLAVLTSINPEIYESAVIDGANRFQRAIHISIPGIKTTIATILILNFGSLFSVGFQKIILMYNPGTYETADVISTYVYRKGILNGDYSFATAVGFFNSVISFLLLYIANKVVKRFTQVSIW